MGDEPILVSINWFYIVFGLVLAYCLTFRILELWISMMNSHQVRDFIHSALYDANHGYFAQRSRSVGVMERSIKFNQLEGTPSFQICIVRVFLSI